MEQDTLVVVAQYNSASEAEIAKSVVRTEDYEKAQALLRR